MSPGLRSPKPPRLPDELSAPSGWALEDEILLSDSLLGGDFAGRRHEGVVFERCRISDAAFTGSELRRSRLTDVVVENGDLSGVDFDESSLNRVKFRDCRMSGVLLVRCKLSDVTLVDCRLDQASFRMSEVQSVVFDDVDLSESDFYAATLRGTRFIGCNLVHTEFSKANTEDVSFQRSDLADLRGGQYLGGSTIETAQVLAVALGVFSALDIQIGDGPEMPHSR